MTYCNTVWCVRPKFHINQLYLIQKIIRAITFSSSRTSSEHLFRSIGILSIHEINVLMVCIFVYKCLFTQAHPCANLLNFYAGNYNTRFSNANSLTVPRINSNLGRQSITYLGTKSYNSVPREYRQNSRSIHTFKSKLKTFILTLVRSKCNALAIIFVSFVVV